MPTDSYPSKPSNLKLQAPIDRWDEAIPLGNGLMGALLWGQGRTIKLSLDRGDLWDLRPVEQFTKPDWTWDTICQLVKNKQQDLIYKMVEEPYWKPWPSKIPTGRIELDLPTGVHLESFGLDLAQALGSACWKQKNRQGQLATFCSATEPVGLMLLQGVKAKPRLCMPAYATPVEDDSAQGFYKNSVDKLGYPAAECGQAGSVQWALQLAAQGLCYAITLGTRKLAGDRLLLAFTVTTNQDAADPVQLGRERIERALKKGFTAALASHRAWWKKFWSASRVNLPDQAIQQHYDLTQYFYGSASRKGAPPIPLQGVWTADEGKLPPWKGDYHHDLNTQLTYWAYLDSGRWEAGECFLDWLWSLLPTAREFARKFFGVEGACLPAVTGLDGQCLGGWTQYTITPTHSAWLCQVFDLHWRYTADRQFLAQRAYPWCSEIGQCLAALLKPDENGKLKLPLSASPEIHNNRLEAWLTPNSNYDLALLRYLFGTLAEMAEQLALPDQAKNWRNILAQLDELALDKDILRISPVESLKESHRHFSHLMAIYPLGSLHVEGFEQDRKVIAASLRNLDFLGSGSWCGYSYSWLACMAARARQPEKALHMLECFIKGFISRNGFHLNGDYKNLGLSSLKYRPFTLEANFAAGQAVHEMLLQSWGGVVRLFPAISQNWKDVRFDELRAWGGHRVSALRRDGQTAWVQVIAGPSGKILLRDPFAGTKAKWSIRPKRRPSSLLEFTLRPGKTLRGQLV